MFKRAIQMILAALVTVTFAGQVLAASDVSIRLAKPKSPSNQNSFDLNFVALDIQNRPITVKCLKQGPSDGAPVQFGGDITLVAGGNSGHCTVTNSVFGPEGSYTFTINAYVDGHIAPDATDNQPMTYDTTGPGDVHDYSKNKTNTCEYTIHFKSADDSGATVKVELYRSDAVPFDANSGSRVQTITVGSNEAKDTTDTPPNCNKTYYYAVRAFDSAGNGSALVGDTVTNITVITPTPGTTQGAIPVSGTGTGSVLGKTTEEGTSAGQGGETLGETSPSAETVTLPEANKSYFAAHPKRSLAIGGGILLLGVILYAFWKRSQNPQE